ncbi:MAG: adenylate/guanylate cyclase domain-containing protein [Alphaproteobacteria bacterium]|nr:adenylate/guanylate cyclase domain-containing protein [Alphaproteobacteria bacterium]
MAAKILVVDDEIDLQELMKRKFRREIRHGEFDFDFASDGVEALEKVKNGAGYDLVVSDINMPRMDGLTLLEHLGEVEDHLRTIIISAYGDMENIRSAMNRGAFDFVTKPIDFHDLLITIKKTLDQIYVIKEALDQRMAAERARANLARYFAPSMVDVLASRDKPFGPPRQQDVGVLFVDIRGFTAISESMSPAEAMEMLRGFHSRVEAVVFEHTGTLEKFIGDAVLATFGTPDTGPQDATKTLTCARELLSVIDQWNQERATTGERPIGVGIGVHYGPAVLGDIGSERSMDFTIIGDTVNTTNRLERLTRTLDTDLVISQALVDKVRDESGGDKPLILSNLWEAGEQEVKGRSGKIPVLALRRLRAA